MWDIQIIGESIKSGLITEIAYNFPNSAIYTEQITEPDFDHFFIEQLTMSTREDRKKYWFLEYLVTIRYRFAPDVALVRNIQEILDRVGLKLLSSLYTINIGGIPARILNPRIEKNDGVLHYFCNIRTQVTKEQLEQVKQNHLTQKRDIK